VLPPLALALHLPRQLLCDPHPGTLSLAVTDTKLFANYVAYTSAATSGSEGRWACGFSLRTCAHAREGMRGHSTLAAAIHPTLPTPDASDTLIYQ